MSDNRSKVPLIASNLCGGTIRHQSVLSVITRDVTLENAANTFARSIKITLVKIPPDIVPTTLTICG